MMDSHQFQQKVLIKVGLGYLHDVDELGTDQGWGKVSEIVGI